MSLADFHATLADRDPETLVGPLLFLFTRLAQRQEAGVRETAVDHLLALALQPGVDPSLRLAAGALALEHRDRAANTHGDD